MNSFYYLLDGCFALYCSWHLLRSTTGVDGLSTIALWQLLFMATAWRCVSASSWQFLALLSIEYFRPLVRLPVIFVAAIASSLRLLLATIASSSRLFFAIG